MLNCGIVQQFTGKLQDHLVTETVRSLRETGIARPPTDSDRSLQMAALSTWAFGLVDVSLYTVSGADFCCPSYGLIRHDCRLYSSSFAFVSLSPCAPLELSSTEYLPSRSKPTSLDQPRGRRTEKSETKEGETLQESFSQRTSFPEVSTLLKRVSACLTET